MDQTLMLRIRERAYHIWAGWICAYCRDRQAKPAKQTDRATARCKSANAVDLSRRAMIQRLWIEKKRMRHQFPKSDWELW